MAVAITQTCNDCAYYSVRNGACLEWRAPVRPSDICQRFIAADGSGRLRAVETKTKEPEVEKVAKSNGTGRRTGLTMEKVAELVTGGWSQQGIADEYGVTKGTVGSHVNRAVKTGLIERVGYGKYAVADGKPEAPEAPAKAESPAEESELHRIGEWILDFDARLRKMEKQMTELGEKVGLIRGDILSAKASQSLIIEATDEICGRLEQVEPGPADYTDRLLGILETQQRVMESLMRRRDDGDQD